MSDFGSTRGRQETPMQRSSTAPRPADNVLIVVNDVLIVVNNVLNVVNNVLAFVNNVTVVINVFMYLKTFYCYQ